MLTATYTVAAPGGSWDAADNGPYTARFNDGQVISADGNGAAGASVTFNVNVPVPPPPVDAGFGGGQTVSSDFVGEAEVSLPDGRLIVVGHQGDGSAGASQYVVERLNADGSLDASFGNSGSVVGPAGGNDAAYAVALADDGGVLVAGSHAGDFAVFKLTADGSLDRRFGQGGTVTTDVGADDAAYALAVAPDGSIVAAGAAGGSAALARYRADGTPDGSFGAGGHLAFGLAGGVSVLGAVAIQANGSIVAAGSTGANVAVVRLNAFGNADGSFGAGGVSIVAALDSRTDSGADRTVGLALQGADVLVANRAGGHFGLARLDAAGNLDQTFGVGGVVNTDFGGDDDADQIILQGSGQIIVLGTTDAGGTARGAVAAYDADGHADGGFGNGGTFTFDAGVAPAGRALHVGGLLLHAFGGQSPDGKLVVGTSNQTPSATTTTGLRRLNVPGSGLVGSFGAVGRRNKKISFLDGHGTRITLSLKGGGTAKAFYDGSNVDLLLSGTSRPLDPVGQDRRRQRTGQPPQRDGRRRRRHDQGQDRRPLRLPLGGRGAEVGPVRHGHRHDRLRPFDRQRERQRRPVGRQSPRRRQLRLRRPLRRHRHRRRHLHRRRHRQGDGDRPVRRVAGRRRPRPDEHGLPGRRRRNARRHRQPHRLDHGQARRRPRHAVRRRLDREGGGAGCGQPDGRPAVPRDVTGRWV